MRYIFNNLGQGLNAMISTHGYFTVNKGDFVSDNPSSSIHMGSIEELGISYSDEFDEMFIPGIGDEEEGKTVQRLFLKWWQRNKAKITAESSSSKISPLGFERYTRITEIIKRFAKTRKINIDNIT